VWRNVLTNVDRGGYSPNTCRNEAYTGNVYFPGQTLNCSFGFLLDPAFPAFGPWSALWQIHTPWDVIAQGNPQAFVSPMTVIDASTPGKLRVQNNAEGGVDYETDARPGRYHYWHFSVQFGRPGLFRVWHALDRKPDLSADAPVVDKPRNTMPPKNGTVTGQYSKTGVYCAIIPTASTWSTLRDGYAETPSTIERADELYREICRPAALGTPPPTSPTNLELVAAARAELEQTTVSGKNWVAGGRKPGHWKNAYARLDEIKD
jgi:hypothetical protein